MYSGCVPLPHASDGPYRFQHIAVYVLWLVTGGKIHSSTTPLVAPQRGVVLQAVAGAVLVHWQAANVGQRIPASDCIRDFYARREGLEGIFSL